MQITQIYSELNNILGGMEGATDINVVDSSSFVSLGNDILSSTNGVTNFGRALGDRIARIISEIDSYVARDRKIWTDNITYGSALKIIHFKDGANTENTMYGNTHKVDPSQLGTMADYTSTVFSKSGVWAYSDLVIQREQLEKAFINESEMSAFLDSQFTIVYNLHEQDKEATDNVAINTMIAQKINNATNKPLQAINLIDEYKTATGTTLTVDAARRSKEFLRFASQFISTVAKQISDKTVLYNNAYGITSATPTDRKVLEVLTDFANDCKYNLESDTYHNDLIGLFDGSLYGGYKEVNYWQGYGDTGTFAEKSYINIKLDGVDDAVEQSGVVACIRDTRLVRSCYDKVYSDTYYNPATRCTTYFFRAEKGYLIDNAYNGVVFYLEELE